MPIGLVQRLGKAGRGHKEHGEGWRAVASLPDSDSVQQDACRADKPRMRSTRGPSAATRGLADRGRVHQRIRRRTDLHRVDHEAPPPGRRLSARSPATFSSRRGHVHGARNPKVTLGPSSNPRDLAAGPLRGQQEPFRPDKRNMRCATDPRSAPSEAGGAHGDAVSGAVTTNFHVVIGDAEWGRFRDLRRSAVVPPCSNPAASSTPDRGRGLGRGSPARRAGPVAVRRTCRPSDRTTRANTSATTVITDTTIPAVNVSGQ